MKYTTIHHLNSKRARKRGLTSKGDHWSVQVLRDPEGDELPRDIPASVMRGFRSRYRRHVGAKQQAKLQPA